MIPNDINSYWPLLPYRICLEQEIRVFKELHYYRYTYYPIHDKCRLDRDNVLRELK